MPIQALIARTTYHLNVSIKRYISSFERMWCGLVCHCIEEVSTCNFQQHQKKYKNNANHVTRNLKRAILKIDFLCGGETYSTVNIFFFVKNMKIIIMKCRISVVGFILWFYDFMGGSQPSSILYDIKLKCGVKHRISMVWFLEYFSGAFCLLFIFLKP